MGIVSFFTKLFGGTSNNAPPIESTHDAVKDASDYYAPQPEILAEGSEPVVEKQNAYERDSDEEAEDIRIRDRQSESRVEEAAD